MMPERVPPPWVSYTLFFVTWGTRIIIPVCVGLIVFAIFDDQTFSDRVWIAFGAWAAVWTGMYVRMRTKQSEREEEE